MASQPFAQEADGQTGLQFTYFGAAGWEISDGDVTVLIDPYISRLRYVDRQHPDDDRRAYARDEVGDWDFGTETTITILRAYGIPDDQLYAVGGGED